MNIEKIYNRLLSSKLLLFIIVFAFIAVRLHPLINQLDSISLWGSLLIQIGIAFFLLQFNHIFHIIQKHPLLPTLFYLLFIGSNPIFYNDLKGSLAALCFVLSYCSLFYSYQKPQSQVNALNISLLLVLGSLVQPSLLFFFPVFWIGFFYFQCFNLRVFLASLTGFVIVYLFIFTWSFYKQDINIFLTLLPSADAMFFIRKPDLSILEWINCGIIVLMYFIVGIYLIFFNISERVWAISAINFFFFSTFIISIFYFLQSESRTTWGLIMYVPIAFLSTYFFSRTNKRSLQYLLLFIFLFLVGINIVQYIRS